MMRTVRFGLVVALALAIAAPLLAGGGGGKGKRGGGGMFGGAGIGRITGALRGLTLSDDEKKATDEILAGVKEKAAELQKKTALTEEQRGKLMEAMADIRGQNLRMGSPEFQDAINKAVGATDDQKAAQKDLAALVTETSGKVKEKLSDANKEAYQKAYDNPMGGRGKGKKKQADTATTT
jgi:gas vesicle protein